MKTTATLLTLALCSGPALGQTIWYHGGTDNSAIYGSAPDSSAAITWLDNWASAQQAGDSFAGDPVMQSTRPNLFGQNQTIMLLGFDNTGLASADVASATLYLTQSFANGTNTWNILGLPAADTGWDNTGMNWTTSDGVNPWSGGDLAGTVAGSFGTFTSSPGLDKQVNLDMTSALQAYLDGTISGIAIVNATNGSTLPATDNLFQAYTTETTTASFRPGLEVVTVIPEPSTALLGALGALALFRRKRHA